MTVTGGMLSSSRLLASPRCRVRRRWHLALSNPRGFLGMCTGYVLCYITLLKRLLLNLKNFFRSVVTEEAPEGPTGLRTYLPALPTGVGRCLSIARTFCSSRDLSRW